MSKLRFTTTDTKAMVRDIRSSLLGQRVANIYDVNDKTYLFKFAVPGVSEKLVLLLESGIRFHTTKYGRDKSDMPSPFAFKLRKYIRTKRLEDVRQLGVDRVVDFRFGSGDAVNHIILELYANGNIILTDGNYEIIALLRSHQFEADVAIKVGEIYPIALAVNLEPTAGDSNPQSAGGMRGPESFLAWTQTKMQEFLNWQGGEATGSGGKKEKQKKMNLRQLLLLKDSTVSNFGPEILDHCLLCSNLSASNKVEELLQRSDRTELVVCLLRQLSEAVALVKLLDTPGQTGYVLYKASAAMDKEYIEFVPKLFKQHDGKSYAEFPSFDECVDEYYCRLEDQKLQLTAHQAEEAARKKVAKVRDEQESILRSLGEQQTRMEMGATLVEVYAEDIDKLFLVLNSALSHGMPWVDVESMVERETAAGNPIAALVTKLRLERSHAILKLRNPYFEEDGDAPNDRVASASFLESQQFVEVEVDITISAYANARKMFDQKKSARVKEEKTVIASRRVLENVEATTMKQLEAQKLKRNLQAVRKVLWFEKFNWFVTSEGYLVLSGRDAQQNEMLVKRYLRHGDVYVHADIPGAASCIVRAKKPLSADQQPQAFSPFALHEAGIMTVCRSRAWDAKMITSAWWVWASQVSKKAPSGEYLTTGSFMIYGKKNFLPPMSLEMGFGIMFRLDDGSVARHLHDRKDRTGLNENDDSQSMLSEAADRYGVEMEALLPAASANDDDGSCSDNSEEAGEEGGIGEADKHTSMLPAPAALNSNIIDDMLSDLLISEGLVGDAFPLDASHLRGHVLHNEVAVYPEISAHVMADSLENDDSDGEDVSECDSDRDESTDKPAAVHATTAIPENGKIVSNIRNKQVQQPSLQQNQSDVKLSAKQQPAVAGTSDKKRADAGGGSALSNSKKKLNKKKARKYQDQDDEDRELAMIALGHLKPGEAKGQRQAEEIAELKRVETQRKMAKAGVKLITREWTELMSQLLPSVRAEIENIIERGLMKPGEIDACEVQSLSTFAEAEALKVLNLFVTGKDIKIVSNKTGYLAGIMRRFSKESEQAPAAREAPVASAASHEDDKAALSRRQKKAIEQKEILTIMEEEGILDEEEGKQADELEKLTGVPLPEDGLLCAIPVCGPYMSMQKFKFKVKLTPGTLKKGKAVKQAVDVFTQARECSMVEKSLMKGLNDPEMVAIMIGDVKVSTPGLQKVQRGQKKEKKSKGK